jgi:uncharacterized membrane protein YGL010W
MKTLRNWLNEYSESHQNPQNKLLHWLCIPQIVFSLFLALKLIPVGTVAVNPATVAAVLALAYYARLSWQLAIGTAVMFGLMYWAILGIESVMGLNGLWLAAAVFIEAWVGQFIGHNIEGARPSFFKDLQFLLIGPLWLLADVYRRMAIPVGKSPAAHA